MQISPDHKFISYIYCTKGISQFAIVLVCSICLLKVSWLIKSFMLMLFLLSSIHSCMLSFKRLDEMTENELN